MRDFNKMTVWIQNSELKKVMKKQMGHYTHPKEWIEGIMKRPDFEELGEDAAKQREYCRKALDEELAAKQALVDGFTRGFSLRDVSRSVKNSMSQKNGGNWLCVIKPSEVEVGLSFHQCRVIQPSFVWDSQRY